MSFINAFATWEQYLVYLRKSRQDDPRETVEEVLEKHETMLQEYALREFGHKIPEENIYREVVSGESIDEREEIKEILFRISDPNIKGVLVVEPSRLSRGDLIDCGTLIESFRYSKTLVVTPYMTYDLENKMERKFFQDELLRGNDYLEYTKEILWRGRVAAAKRGCYATGGPAPFGYKKVKDGKDWILEIVPENAEVVRMMFDWYTREGMSPGAIGRKLQEMGIKTAQGNIKWHDATVRQILSNKHYQGLIVFNSSKEMTFFENGQKVKRRVKQKPEDIIIAKGKHPAIIDDATFEAAQNLFIEFNKNKVDVELKNLLSGLLRCGRCGSAMIRGGDKVFGPKYVCRSKTPQCVKAAKEHLVVEAVIDALENIELPALKLKVQNDAGNAIKIQQRLIANLQDQLAELESQEENLFELLETKVYTADMFSRRHAALASKIEACRAELEKAKRAMPKAINYQEKAESLEAAIKLCKNPEATIEEKNKQLKAVIDHIEYFTPPPSECKYGETPFTLKFVLRL